ncbi:hypothetical protein AIOL_001806 [Candidatus Rhodobacter oscarellae]|uniref:Uncharacterized protein n=1 Tax=Candidatus Rhodobacter oscarellae TaxID=1675527 RepID=A0A0J9E4W1_9RHOB|nr:hypothetical protein AIOL_001806 [Candidatus Rhodobacter lobularis]
MRFARGDAVSAAVAKRQWIARVNGVLRGLERSQGNAMSVLRRKGR